MAIVFAGLVLILAGSLMIAFRRSLSRLTIRAQNWTWGSRFGLGTLRFTERVAVPVTSVGFIVAGFLFLLVWR
jgi:hypothetical protein